MSKELTTTGGYTALEATSESLTMEEMVEELGGEAPRFPRIKIPAGGSIAFEVPSGDDKDPDVKKTLEGVVVWHHNANAYWDVDEDSNSPPTCSSLDGKRGVRAGAPVAIDCHTCPLNQFGSGEGGKGKACKNMKRLYLLTQESMFPYSISLPPTSLGKYTDYVSANLSKNRKACDVVTRITLAKKESAGGQEYSQAQFSTVGALDPGIKELSRRYRETIKMFVAQGTDVSNEYAVQRDEYEEPDGDLPFVN